MKWFYDLKIVTKLLIGFTIVAIITAAIGIIGVVQLRKTDTTYSNMYNSYGVSVSYMGNIGISLNRIRVNLFELVNDKNLNNQNEYLNKINTYNKTIKDNLNEYKVSATEAQDNKNYNDLSDKINSFQASEQKVINLVSAGQVEQALRVIQTETDPLSTNINNLIDTMFGYNVNTGENISNQITKSTNSTEIMLIVILIIGALVAFGLGLFIAMIISRPLKNLVEVSDKLALGDIDVSVEATTKDEIGILMNSFSKMIANIRIQAENAAKIANGDLKVEIRVNSEKDALSKSMKQVVETLRAVEGEINRLVVASNKGMLNERADDKKFVGDWAKLMKDLNGILEEIMTPLNESMDILNKMSFNDYTEEMIGHYEGSFKEFADSINAVHGRLLSVQDAIERIGKGDTSRLEEFQKLGKRCENDKIMPACTSAQKAIRELVNEVGMLANSAINGKLDVKSDSSKFEGGYKEIIEGLNKTIEAVAKPIQEASDVMKELAKGNLTVSMDGDYKGEYATIKNDINATIESFNTVLNDINVASEQVASGSTQVSDSSIMLSQGATEQASTIEQLTSSMEEIASQTRQNAVNANEANELALDAKNGAADGNNQMKEMLKAMEEINDSSSNIYKIIKVIDDIAFQTNILALNAAVEAARAGQHGKGFAVVAEEVRNLAARSASAAKETTDMIEGSIKKVEAGTRLANETAGALNKIVDSVAKATKLVGQIAEASNEQAIGIDQVNQGIIQVSQVVQTNSATAEESASASEELSGQAELLKQQVDKFKLKKVSSMFKNIDQLNPETVRMIESMVEKEKFKSNHNEKTNIAPAKNKIILNDNEYGKY